MAVTAASKLCQSLVKKSSLVFGVSMSKSLIRNSLTQFLEKKIDPSYLSNF
jgi:hypothetical protein